MQGPPGALLLPWPAESEPEPHLALAMVVHRGQLPGLQPLPISPLPLPLGAEKCQVCSPTCQPGKLGQKGKANEQASRLRFLSVCLCSCCCYLTLHQPPLDRWQTGRTGQGQKKREQNLATRLSTFLSFPKLTMVPHSWVWQVMGKGRCERPGSCPRCTTRPGRWGRQLTLLALAFHHHCPQTQIAAALAS